MFELLKTEGKARRGVFTCAHGTVQTPVFMNVGTQGAIKGALSAEDLKNIGCQVELSNTYHLHLRPTDTVVRQMGGLHKFMTWDGPILTDSGGFQVFSLASLRKIKEEGVYFASHIDGHKIFMGPEESMQIQSNLGSDICMAFDECIENPSPRDYVQKSVDRTYRWLVRCKAENARLNSLPDTVNPHQMLWGINQGGTYPDIRIDHMKRIADLDLPGYAIGGLAVGETAQEMYDIIDAIEPYMPREKTRYLMGVGTPTNIIEGVARGVDFFDCVMPAPLTPSATAPCAAGIPERTSAICSWRRRCWPCACALCTICIFIISLCSASGMPWMRELSAISAGNTPKSWQEEFDGIFFAGAVGSTISGCPGKLYGAA